MIKVRMSVTDLGRTRFAYSPLAEIAESLYLISSRRVPPPHQLWWARIRPHLGAVDLGLLTSVVPPKSYVADFLFMGATDPTTSVQRQLQLVADMPVDALRQDLKAVWRDTAMPPVLDKLLSDRANGPRRLADALADYWKHAIEPYWSAMRAVLDEDVAYRARALTQRGVEGLLSEMHPELVVQGDMIRIEKKRHPAFQEAHDLTGTGLLLVPSIFVWPNLIFAPSRGHLPSLTYPARGVGRVWESVDASASEEDSLGALLGRSRAAILTALEIPHSTTDLALSLGHSPPSVSQHLSVLRRSGLVVAWRSGRRVLYRRTRLATSIVEAGSVSADDVTKEWA